MSSGLETADVIEPWLWATLTSDPQLTALVGGNIINAAADQGDPPYVVFNLVSARDVRGVGTTRVQVDCIYQVKAVVAGSSFDAAAAIARRVFVLLETPQTVSTPAGALTCTREQIVQFPDTQDGAQYRHVGGLFRLRTHSTL